MDLKIIVEKVTKRLFKKNSFDLFWSKGIEKNRDE